MGEHRGKKRITLDQRTTLDIYVNELLKRNQSKSNLLSSPGRVDNETTGHYINHLVFFNNLVKKKTVLSKIKNDRQLLLGMRSGKRGRCKGLYVLNVSLQRI